MTSSVDILERHRREMGLAIGDLWFRYFALGGMSTVLEVEAILYGARVATNSDRNLLAVALNERYAELGRDHPVPYIHLGGLP